MHEAQLELAEAHAAELWRQMGRPEATLAHLVLERLDHLEELVVGQLERLEGEDLLLDEAPHPLELALELWLSLEVPGHRPSSGPAGPMRPSELQ